MSKRSIFIDADTMVYRHGFKAQATVLLPDGSEEIELTEDITDVLDSVQQALDSIIHDTRADRWSIFIGGKGNYRQDIATMLPYKGNRDSSNKPLCYDAIREYLADHCEAIVVDGEEADDAVSYSHMKAYWDFKNGMSEYEPCIVSNDKDLLNTRGWHYNPQKKEFKHVSAIEAERNFYKQMFSGDSSDNIPGLYKITGVKATKKIKDKLDELETAAEMYAYVEEIWREAFVVSGKDEDTLRAILLEIGRLLWIRREPQQLWEPNYELCET